MRQNQRCHTLLFCLVLLLVQLCRRRVPVYLAELPAGFAVRSAFRNGKRQERPETKFKAAYVCRTGTNRGVYTSLEQCANLNPNKEIRVFKGGDVKYQAQLYMLTGKVGLSKKAGVQTELQKPAAPGVNQAASGMNINFRSPLPFAAFAGNVHVVRSGHETIEWQKLKSAAVLGFDTEWYGGEDSPVALIQIATADECWIFQMLEPFGVSQHTKAHLSKILQNSNIIKTGVGVDYDFVRLQTQFPGMKSAGGLLDLRDLEPPNQIDRSSLQKLTRKYLRLDLSKHMQCSNWSLDRLAQSQIMYAATDAWVGWRLYKKMRERFPESTSWAMPCEWAAAKSDTTLTDTSPNVESPLKLSDLLRQTRS